MTIEAPAVRRKSSFRKQRSGTAPRQQREPTQQRSRERRDAILDAAESLLQSGRIEDLLFSELSRIAKVSRASIHYHFPTISQLQYELGRRYDGQLSAAMSATREREAERSGLDWQGWIRMEAETARAWFNACRPACEALLGPLLTRENRMAGWDDNGRVAAAKLEHLRRIFVMPETDMLELAFRYNVELTDLFFATSYQTHGEIDDQALEDAVRASTGYLRNFLPSVLEPRAP